MSFQAAGHPLKALRKSVRPTLAGLVVLAASLNVQGAHAQSDLISLVPRSTNGTRQDARTVTFAGRTRRVLIGGNSGELVITDAQSGVVQTRLQLRGAVTAVTVSRDERFAAAGSLAGEVQLIDLERGSGVRLAQLDEVRALAFSPTGDILAVGLKGGEIALIATESTRIVGRLRDTHNKAIQQLAWIGNYSSTLLSTGEDRRLVWWDVKQLRPLRQSMDVDQSVRSTAINTSATLLALGTESFLRSYPGQPNVYRNSLRLYNAETGVVEKVIDLLGRTPTALAISPDQQYVASTLRDTHGTSLVVWDIARGVSVLDQPLASRANALAFANSGSYLSVATEQGALLYDVQGITPRTRIAGGLRGDKIGATSPRQPLITGDRRTRLAVLELEDNGVGPDIARAIAEQLDNILASNPAVRLVERRRMNAILSEQQFQRSGRTDPATAVQIARILNVDRVLLGAVSRLGTRIDITVRSVDVTTAAITGVRGVRCEACALEELGEAVGELAEILVRQPTATELAYPSPPEIDLQYPRAEGEVAGDSVTVRARVRYSGSLEGVELIVNGEAFDATRLLSTREGKLTRVINGTQDMIITQTVALSELENVIAVRAIGADGNDEQQYLKVRRKPAAKAAAPQPSPPGIAFEELVTALVNKVPGVRLASLLEKFGVSFELTEPLRAALQKAGADTRVLEVCARAKRVAGD